jgi:hypothetical protein
MTIRRTIGVLFGLATAGALFGALAGGVVATMFALAMTVRHGAFTLPLSWFGAMLGASIGAGCGAVLAPTAAFTPWRRVPLGRLFTGLTIGTIIGGTVAALLVPSGLGFVLAGALLGFLIAGDRLTSRSSERRPGGEPRHPAA